MVNKAFDIEKRDNYDNHKEINNEIKIDNDIKDSIGEKVSSCCDCFLYIIIIGKKISNLEMYENLRKK